MGAQARQSAAVFTTLEAGEAWVRQHSLEGMLTWYPLDLSAYDWAVERGSFRPTTPHHRSAAFLASFSSALQPHHHYEPEDEG
ncbi:hypothetical protein [Deinococcus sp.]|uniref:DUF7710 domain-containing protein n=1 Tax=Deinococcus sp. TaxID=47478 RepID=UPI0025D3E023|nr:hypothetical protein [Deinococcus sp.]